MTLYIALAVGVAVSTVICIRQTIDNVRDERARSQHIIDRLAPLERGRKPR